LAVYLIVRLLALETTLVASEMKHADLVERYRNELYPRYRSFAERLSGLLTELVTSAGVDVSSIEHRAKTPESVSGKLRMKSYENPLSEIKDFAGVRIITYYSDDVRRVAALLKEEFALDPQHSVDKLETLEADELDTGRSM
jgi:ppGpp synthetase/RelA/SpoT-type nucleotidyltranferase